MDKPRTNMHAIAGVFVFSESTTLDGLAKEKRRVGETTGTLTGPWFPLVGLVCV